MPGDGYIAHLGNSSKHATMSLARAAAFIAPHRLTRGGVYPRLPGSPIPARPRSLVRRQHHFILGIAAGYGLVLFFGTAPRALCPTVVHIALCPRFLVYGRQPGALSLIREGIPGRRDNT